jgi:hypothetical protein
VQAQLPVEELAAEAEAAQEQVHPAARLQADGERYGARQLEHQKAVLLQGAQELVQIALDGRPAGLMLQHDAREDQVERAVFDPVQVSARVHLEAAAGAVGVQLPRAVHHRLRDVESEAALETLRQGSREAAHAAAEVERRPSSDGTAELLRARHQLRDLRLAGAEELLTVPGTELAVGVREDRPEGVLARDLLPLALLIAECLLPHLG